MINFKPDTVESFEEYKCAVNRKNTSLEKEELLGIEKVIETCYSDYQQKFAGNSLETLLPSVVALQHKKVLLGLYSSKALIIRNFRERCFAQNPQTYNNLCPYCTLNESGTTEHILPKEKYPEFAVDTLNLIPACSNCNEKKNEKIVDANGKKTTINFYLDQLPQSQYLFVDFTIIDSSIKATYSLDNTRGLVESGMFSLIERHFKQYDLLDRFNTKAIQEISELKNLYAVEEFANEEEYAIFADKQLKKVNLDKASFGVNHWKVILYLSAATSEVFKKYILSL